MARAVGTTRLFWHLVEESFSEASFLWTKLDSALDAHDYVFAEVYTWAEDRLLGALDGVRLAGVDAIKPLLLPGLGSRDDGAVSASAFLLSAMSTPHAERVLELGLRAATPEHTSAFARGLGRAAQVEALRALWLRMQDAAPHVCAAVLEALAFCGHAPDADWLAMLTSEDVTLRGVAADALRFAPARVRQELSEHTFFSSDRAVRNRALLAGVAAGDSLSWQRCVALARSADAQAGPLFPAVAMLGAEREHGYLQQALSTPMLCRDALWALGFAGTASAAEICLRQMQEGPHAQVAAEAFCAITGLELSREGLATTRAEPDQELPALEDDDLDADLVPSADDELPYADVDGVSAWWARHRARFKSDRRYLAGQPASFRILREALDRVSTRRRHAVALELAARSGGACVLQPWAFTRVQQEQLRGFPSVPEAALNGIARGLGFARLETA